MSEEFEYLEEYRHPYSACLNLTDSCSMRCIYCFVQQQPNFMTFQVAKDGVDWLAANLNWWREYTHDPQFKGSITYFGGEPTLMWDEIIVPLTAYIKETYPDYFDLTITTNGTLLNEERIKFLYDNQIYPLLSIDGVKEVQDYNRPMRDGSSGFDKLIKIIPYLLSYFPSITFRSTVIPDTVDKLFESYCFAEDIGFSNIFFCPNERITWTQEEKEKLKNQLHLIMARRFANYSNNKNNINSTQINNSFIDVLTTDLIRYNNAEVNNKFSHHVMRCGLGTSLISIAYNGNLYSCQEQDSRSADIFHIGNIYSGINKEKHYKLLQEYNKPQQMKNDLNNCDNCVLQHSCTMTSCPSTAYDVYKDFFTRNSIDCTLQQTLYYDCIIMMKALINNTNSSFHNYLNSLYSSYEKEEE